jgi:hypothetical protein
VLAPAAVGHLAALEARLPATEAVTARTAMLAGCLLFEAGALGPGYRALSLGVALGDGVVKAKAQVGRAATMAQLGDQRRALAFLDDAITILAGEPARARPGPLVRRAVMRAAAGDADGALRDLDLAENAIAAAGPYEWWYMSPEHPHEFGAYRGVVMAALGRHVEAVEAFEWTLARMPVELADWRTTIERDRDRALAAG